MPQRQCCRQLLEQEEGTHTVPLCPCHLLGHCRGLMLSRWRNHVLSPSVSPGASEEGRGNFRNSSPRTGKAFAMFLAEIGLSTSLPVLLLPVRPVAEEMLNPRHSSAYLGRARAGRLLPLCRINPSSCGGSFLQIQNK